MRPGRGHDDVLSVAVAAGRGVAEVRGCCVGLGCDLMIGRCGRSSSAVVVPDTGECSASRVADVRAGSGAGLGVRSRLAELGHDPGPQLAARADSLEHLLQDRRHAIGVAGQEGVAGRGIGRGRAPLAAPEDEIDLRGAGGDADAVGAAVVDQVS